MKKSLSVILMLFFCVTAIFSQNILGTWKTVDDEDGEEKSHVEIFKGDDGLVYGKIIKILNEKDVDEVCSSCDDHRKDKPIMGMQVITGMIADGGTYKKGKILDPANGKEYKCKIWLEGLSTLMVRGYLGPFFRTQKWFRVN